MSYYLIPAAFCFVSGIFLAYMGIVGLTKNKVVLYPHERVFLWIAHIWKPDISHQFVMGSPKSRGITNIVGGMFCILMGAGFTLFILTPSIFEDQVKANTLFIAVWVLTAVIYFAYLPWVLTSSYRKKFLIGIAISLPFMGYMLFETAAISFIISILTTLWVFMLLTMILPLPISYYEELKKTRQEMQSKSHKPRVRKRK